MPKNMNKEKVTIQIGKNGFGDGQVNEITKNIYANKEVTLRLLKSFIAEKDKKDVAKEISAAVGKKVKVETKLVGNVMTIKRKK